MTEISGDRGLADRLRSVLGRRHPVAAAATVSGGQVRAATVGAPLDADFEIGSISKGLTGLLYADAVQRGEVRPSALLGEFLSLDGTAAAEVTLASLSTHRSGLPRLPRGAASLRRSLALWVVGRNPYGEDLPELIAQARRTPVGRPRHRYSNLGYELLGHALAQAAGTEYPTLLCQRLAEPLGIRLSVPASADSLLPGALRGRSRFGSAREPWTGAALGPAGGIRASIPDLGRLTAALLDGSAPGVAALDPVERFAGPAVRIGAAWITLERHGRSITWHNGGTGGFRSWLGMDRAAGTGVVVMTATSRSVDRHGFRLLAELRNPG